MVKPDIEQIAAELFKFRGGIVDTCTLIYLERIHLLSTVSQCFQLLILPDIVQEFGRHPTGCTLCKAISAAGPDQAVVRLAHELQLPVLSEDRQVLMAARSQGLRYYNTMMILLALLLQKKINLAGYEKAYASLLKFARYSSAVRQVGEQVFSLYIR
jgi:hypothetical protein